jgi:cellulose biosynthesis protein BcsQ
LIHNLFSFHGADHKVGTTMITQSVAEIITADNPGLKVLLIAMNGSESAEYFREAPSCIDALKFHIDNRTITGEDFLKACTHKGNFYIMAGISNELEAHYYHPDMAKYLLEEVAPEFDLVIADSGNELDNGLAVGTLTESGEVLFITTQQESAVRRYERNRRLLDDLGVDISLFLVNKYSEQDPYGLPYLASRMSIERDRFMKIDSASYSRQAEIDYRTLLEYKNEAYRADIAAVANYILNKAGFPEIRRQRKNKWRSFI